MKPFFFTNKEKIAEVRRLEDGGEESDSPVGEVASQTLGSEALQSMPHPPLPSPNFFIKTQQFPIKSTDSCLGPFSFAETEYPTG